MSSIILPVVTIQHSFPEVVQEVQDGVIPSDKIWISCYKQSEPSVHSKVQLELDEVDRNLVSLKTVEGDATIFKTKGVYTVECNSLNIPPTRVLPSLQEYKDDERSNPSKPQRITAFAVSPDSTRFATGYLDGSVFLYPTSEPKSSATTLVPQAVDVTKAKVISKPHLSGVSSIKFFPSSRVILSSGQDFSINILSADLPDVPSQYGTRIQPVRTMRSHIRRVTDTAIIGSGRNIVSSSHDASIKLWDVPTGEVIATLPGHGPITAISLGERMPVPPDGEERVPPPSTDSREIAETNSKIVFTALQDGSFEVLDLGFKRSIFRSPTQRSPLNSIAYSENDHLLATGSAGGTVSIYDTRSLGVPVTSFSRLPTEIEALSFALVTEGGAGLAIASSDGLPYVASVVPEGPAVHTELIGVDCDPVRHISVREVNGKTHIWSASDDGIVRRYVL